MENMRGRGRGRRGRGRGRGAARGKKPVERKEDAIPVEEEEEEPIAEPSPVPVFESQNAPQIIPPLDMEADISQLEAPTFTTISRGPSEPMLRLRWGHPVNLIGEKVLNPMIHCCDICLRPVFIYGRMIPCKHVFCLACAQREGKQCPRCRDKVVRVEQTGLGTVFMCTHGGTRYGNNGCRRTYLSQRDLQAHINHRHVAGPPTMVNSIPLQCNKTAEKTENRLPATALGAPPFYEAPKVKMFDDGDISYQPPRVLTDAPAPCAPPPLVRPPPPVLRAGNLIWDNHQKSANLITVPIQEPPPEPPAPYFNAFNPPPVVSHGPPPIHPPTQPPPYYSPYDYPPPPTDTSIPPPNQWPGNPPYYG